MEAVIGSVCFEGVKLVLYLYIDVFVLSFGFTALCLDHPHRTVFFHHDIIGVE